MPQLTPPKPSKFPPIPEFYGGEPGPRVSNEPATNQADWSNVYRQSQPPAKSIMEMFSEVMDDPRNAWLGLGPVAGAVKGARLIKPMVEANTMLRPGVKATEKTLMRPGSEIAASILDFDPALQRTTHPLYGKMTPEALSYQFSPSYAQPLTPPITPDEIVAAQDILKKLAQQGAPPTTTLYRGGEPVKGLYPSTTLPPHTPVPATSDLTTATEFAMAQPGVPRPLFELQVPRADLLANIEKLQRGRGYKEHEYLIPLRAFQNAQTRLPFDNPYPSTTGSKSTYYPGLKRKPAP